MSGAAEFVIDGNEINKQLEPFQLEAYQPTSQLHHMLPGQVFDIVEKKLIKGLLEQIEKAKPSSVKFVNLEAIATGPHKEYVHPICGGLRVLIDTLNAKSIPVTGVIENPWILPWTLVAKINPNFKGLPAPGETTPP